MINYNELKEEQQIERELKALEKVMKEREQRKQFAETLQNTILKKMVLDTISDNNYLFELPYTKASANLDYYDNWRNDSMKESELNETN